MTTACRALDRVDRAGRYWVPHWYLASHRIAYWDVFARPAAAKPRYARGIPETWWHDPAKAAKLETQIAHEVQIVSYLPPCGGRSARRAGRGVRQELNTLCSLPPTPTLPRKGGGRASASEDQSMTAYIIRRLLFMIPTLFGIMLVSFVVVQFAPGGPVERVIAQLSGRDTGATSRISGSPGGDFGAGQQMPGGAIETVTSKYRGAQGLDPEFIKSLEKQFGFDKPAHERFFLMLWNYARFDFGKSYFRDVSVLQLVKEKLPVSISLGIWMTLLTYLISIPLGIRKAVYDGTRFDTWTSAPSSSWAMPFPDFSSPSC